MRKTIKRIMKHFTTVPSVANFVYPPMCGICGKLYIDFLCNKCNLILKKEFDFCVDNYKSVNYTIEKINSKKKYFMNHLYIFKYQGIIRKLILDYKFNDNSYLHYTFVNFLLKDEMLFENLKCYDTIIPVPISKKRRKQRGYNQCELIAKKMAFELGINYNDNCLLKVKDVLEQSKLSREDRLINIQNVYLIRNKEYLKNKRVLLIDDIYTTGSTVNECSKVLIESGAKTIDVFTMAKD